MELDGVGVYAVWRRARSGSRAIGVYVLRSMGRALDALSLATPWLWGGAVVFFGVGDLATTLFGLTSGFAAERSPFIAYLVHQYGMGVLVPLKVAVLSVFYGAWRVLPEPVDVGIPLALSVVGIEVTVWNLAVLLSP